jgi:hypothetical protein
LFRAAPRDLILVGGLALSGPPFQTLLMERLQAGIPALRPRTPILSPAHGAALLALRHGGVPWTEDLLGNLALASGNAAAGHEGFAR